MFVVIEDGSRQYTIQEGDTLTIDYRATAKAGDPITFESVLLANGGGASSIGTPTIEGASVEAEVVQAEVKGEKLEIQKFRRRKNSRRHTGHRQKYTTVQIKTITVPGLEIVESEAAEETETATAEG
ncbi:50S ribosomal protein L21 [Gimesia sp.]|uniref:50S ribosomal protein L21 n=1 Tax=Gimesia sp. TaxID=2024833 RepID=UPI003A94F39F